MARYLSDLLMSICLALTVGWLFQAAIGNIHLRDAMITQNGTYVAISRFTPGNLVTSYLDTVEHMTQLVPVSYHLADGVGAVIEQTVVMVAGLLLAICVGVPATLIGLYRAAGGVAGWVVLAGFGIAIGAVFNWLRATKITSRRLLVGLALVPLAITVVFIILEALIVAVLATCFWFASLAPFMVVGRDALLGLLAGISEASIAGLWLCWNPRSFGYSPARLSDQRSPVILSHSRANCVCVLRNASQSVGASTLKSVIGMPPAGGGTSARGE